MSRVAPRARKRKGPESPRRSASVAKASRATGNGEIAKFDAAEFLAKAGLGKTLEEVAAGKRVFAEGDPAETIFHIKKGQVKISVVSKQGKEAILAVLGAGEFLGEECIATTHPVRLATATALADTVLLKISKTEMMRVLRHEHDLSAVFVTFLLARNARMQADLIDQLFNSSEKRLARILLLLAQFGKEGRPEKVIPKISQESLAEMVGTTRSRVSFFMNRFRKMGFIEYDGEIEVHSSLLRVALHD